MSKLKSLIWGLVLVCLLTSCGKEIIYIEKEPDGSWYENLDPAVRSLIRAFEQRGIADYVSDFTVTSADINGRIIPANGGNLEITIEGFDDPWDLMATEIYPAQIPGGRDYLLANNVTPKIGREIRFSANTGPDVTVWEIQISPSGSNQWSYLDYYVQMPNANELVYEIDGMDTFYNTIASDHGTIEFLLRSQNIMTEQTDVLWFEVFEEERTEPIASGRYNMRMVSLGTSIDFEIGVNESFSEIRRLYIEYYLQGTSERYRLCNFIQKPGEYVPEVPKAEVTDVVYADENVTYVAPLGGPHTLRLVGEFYEETQINIMVFPYQHSAYERGNFTPIVATAYKEHPSDPSLDNWKFVMEFPSARGSDYATGEADGGWHKDFASQLAIGCNSAGFWSFYYEVDSSWVPFRSLKQEAYYISVMNEKQGPLPKNGGEWILKTKGEWPEGAVKFRAVRVDELGNHIEFTSEVTVNRTSEHHRNSWVDAPPIIIPAYQGTRPAKWRLQYFIDLLGGWETWDDFHKLGTPEYEWEGDGHLMTQKHF